MKRWIELCSDVNWEDYHGMWARKAADGTWFVLCWTNMWDAAGEDSGLDQYECSVKSLDLSELSEENIGAALESCGLRVTAEGIVTDQGDVIEPAFAERALLESCIGYGFGAPLESFAGSKYPLRIRAEARRYAERCMADATLHAERLARPVNAIGSTAHEYGTGDINAALFRGNSLTLALMRKLHSLPETV